MSLHFKISAGQSAIAHGAWSNLLDCNFAKCCLTVKILSLLQVSCFTTQSICCGTFSDHFVAYKFSVKSVGKRICKICQHLANLHQKNKGAVFWLMCTYTYTYLQGVIPEKALTSTIFNYLLLNSFWWNVSPTIKLDNSITHILTSKIYSVVLPSKIFQMSLKYQLIR